MPVLPRTPSEDPMDEDDLWFLPGPPLPEEDGDSPVGGAPRPVPLFEVSPWRDAQSDMAIDLAHVAALFGALDERLHAGPGGWRDRLALRETANLSWWSGDRLSEDRIALWIMLRTGATDDSAVALQRAGWAMRRLTARAAPATDIAGFLELAAGAGTDGAGEAALDLRDVIAGEGGLHPIVAACRVFHAWRAVRSSRGAAIEAAVLAACHGARTAPDRNAGLPFLPLVQTGPTALRGQGPVANRLSAWLSGAGDALLAARLHLDRLERWQHRATTATAGLSGRTPPALIALLRAWPQITAAFAAAQTGASRAAIQRNLHAFETLGLVDELTGQARFRVWAARL